MDPVAEHARLPQDYGTPTRVLGWAEVRDMLVRATVYWIATIRPDGAPHVVPVDGLWLDDVWYYGGSPATRHMRNVASDPRMVMHIGGANTGVIVEGSARSARPTPELADRLAELTDEKYDYGRPDPSLFDGAMALQPSRVLAWTSFPDDVTRFRF